jgi:hypothetical protein
MNLRVIGLFTVAVVLVLSAVLWAQTPLDSRFSYQGQIKQNGSAVNSTCDFQFALYDAATNGIQWGSTLNLNAVSVTNGLFTVTLDFGTVFRGDKRWLEIQARCPAASGNFVMLSPRQELTASPYAFYAWKAGTATYVSNMPWSGLTGVPLLVTSVTASAPLSSTGGTTPNISLTGTIADSYLATISTAGKVANSATTATAANNPNAIVARDGSGNFSAGVITANLNGTATNASSTPWSGLTGVPADFADGVDNDTTYTASSGILLKGTSISADITYLQRRVGTGCAAGQLIQAIDINGTPSCIPAPSTTHTHDRILFDANGSLQIVPAGASNTSNIIGGYSGNVVDSGKYGATIGGGGSSGSTCGTSGNQPGKLGTPPNISEKKSANQLTRPLCGHYASQSSCCLTWKLLPCDAAW